MSSTGKRWKRRGGKTGGRDFQPGPDPRREGCGRKPKAPEDLKIAAQQIRILQSDLTFDWQHYYRELVGLPVSELAKIVGGKDSDGKTIPPADPNAPMLKLLVARSLLYALRSGKASEVLSHKDAMCGPAPKQVELSGPGGEPLSPVSRFNQEQLTNAFAALDKLVQEAECKSTQNSSQPLSVLPLPSSAPVLDTAS